MFGKNRPSRDDSRRYSRQENAGYDDRFGSYGMRGPERHSDREADAYMGQNGNQGYDDNRGPQRTMGYSDYASFEGTSDRPYYGGEEGRYPYGGASMNSENDRQSSNMNQDYPHTRNSWNSDEKNYSGNWMAGEHAGKGPKGYRRADGRIHEEICEMLTRHGEIDASEVEVDVKDGIATLTGTVESRRIKRMAEDLVERINGVHDVRNDLRVMARGISSEMVSDFTSFTGSSDQSQPTQGSMNSGRSRNVGESSRSSGKATKQSSSSSRRMS